LMSRFVSVLPGSCRIPRQNQLITVITYLVPLDIQFQKSLII